MKVKILLFFSLLFISCSKQDETIYTQYPYNFSQQELEVMHVTNVYISIKQDSNGRKYYTFIFVKI